MRKPKYSFFTEEQCELIRESEFTYPTVVKRVKRGMSFEEAITKPLQRTPITPEQRKKAKENGIDMKNVYSRKRLGWTIEEAITIPINAHYFFTEEELSIAASNGVTKTMLQNRFYTLGWTIEEAITTPKHGKYGRNIK